MFRIWIKIFQDNRMIKNTVIIDESHVNRTKKVLNALEVACEQFDIELPIWLELNIEDFKRHSKTRFRQDNFIEEHDFDYVEIHVIEED